MSWENPCVEDAFGGDLNSIPRIEKAWRETAERLDALRGSLEKELAELQLIAGVPTSGMAVFLAGSYGRLEAFSDVSDADVIVVLPDGDPPPDSETRAQVLAEIASLLRRMGLPECNPEGVFTACYTRHELIAEAGKRDEDTRILSQRMLLMMEARPVYNREACQAVIDTLIQHYTEYQASAPQKELVYLLNDCVRYFRTVCVSYQYSFRNDPGRWALRNTKLRHSRVVMYMGLLLLLLNASAKQHAEKKPDYLRSKMYLPPLARAFSVISEIGRSADAEQILKVYDAFLAGIDSKDKRNALACSYENCATNASYMALKDNSDELARLLAKVVYDQRGAGWSDRVFEYLLL